jgi:hypothetical protein
MSLPPRAVVVSRRTEYEDLLLRHGTRSQAAFFLETRGRDLAEVAARHAAQQDAIAAVSAAIPVDWRRGAVERNDLDRFLFAADDVVVAVGPDGLVANVAKYLDGQPVVGVNPEPDRNAGVLVRNPVPAAARLLQAAAAGSAGDELTMVELRADDGQSLVALNEVYVGHASHQTARYSLSTGDRRRAERQASSGVLVGTGTGCTGWCRSAWQERGSTLPLPAPSAPGLVWFVREPWPSPATGTTCTEGLLAAGEELLIVVESDTLVAFGDGIESDAVALRWGQTVTLRVAKRRLRLL